MAAALNGASVSIVRLNDDGARSSFSCRFRCSASAPCWVRWCCQTRVVKSTTCCGPNAASCSSPSVLPRSSRCCSSIALGLHHRQARSAGLSAAAQKVRRGVNTRVEIPDFTRTRDEIGHLSGSLRDMTGALYKRIDAIEAFAADVAMN